MALVEEDDIDFVSIEHEIAKHVVAIYELEPFVMPNGALGIHFVNLSTSIETDLSVFTEVEELVDDVAEGPISTEDKDIYIDVLTRWQATLKTSLDKVTTALQKVQAQEIRIGD
jgi:hypothetical protein